MRDARVQLVARLFAAACALAAPGSAATVGYLTDGQLAAASDRIIHGRVASVRTETASGGRVYTVAAVEVFEDLTGVAGPVVEIREFGGATADSAMVVPGVPAFTVGEEILACLERSRDGRYHRLLALGFSLFSVTPEAGAARLQRQDQDLVVLGRPAVEGGSRTLSEFRRVVGAVRGTTPVTFPRRQARVGSSPTVVEPFGGGPTLSRNFTLLGGGVRWNEVDSGRVIVWSTNASAPAPVDGSDGAAETLAALDAWTTPVTAAITLGYGGVKDIGSDSPYCDVSNAGSGLISFEDPTDEIASGVLAIGGGCTTTVGRTTVNGVAFDSFTHGFAVLNNTAQVGPAYRTRLNFARLVEHEVGHGIGLGHNLASASGAQGNIMFASCCYASTPAPPAIGPDDLAGLEFIYPAGALGCTVTVAPSTIAVASAATESTLSVRTSAETCFWRASSDSPWLTLVSPGDVPAPDDRLDSVSAFGSRDLRFRVAANAAGARTGTITLAEQPVVVTQEAYDSDEDGLPDSWEKPTGLDPFSAAGPDGAGGDPDDDGLTNMEEWQTGGHPRGFYRIYLAEGVASAFFFTETAVTAAVPPARDSYYVRYEYTMSRGGGGRPPCVTGYEVPVRRWFRATAAPCNGGFPDGATAEVSTLLESDVPLVVERTVSWPFYAGSGPVPSTPTADTYGAHAEGDIGVPGSSWYFAEGATHSGFDLFYLVRNAETRPVVVRATFLRPAPLEPVTKEYLVDADSRLTIWANQEDERLAAVDVAAVFTTDGSRIVVERAMYASSATRTFSAGAAAMGSHAPQARWLFAEGATGSYFDTFLLMANPGDEVAEVDARFLLPAGQGPTRHYSIPARSRVSVWLDAEDDVLADTSLGVDLVSTNGVPVVAERAMWWPGPSSATWFESHASAGAVGAASHWITSDGECGGERNARTYLLLLNPGDADVSLAVQLMFSDGVGPTRTLSVPRGSRRNIDVEDVFPEARDRRFAAEVLVLAPSSGAVVVERSTYWDGPGQPWAAGVNVRATRVP